MFQNEFYVFFLSWRKSSVLSLRSLLEKKASVLVEYHYILVLLEYLMRNAIEAYIRFAV